MCHLAIIMAFPYTVAFRVDYYLLPYPCLFGTDFKSSLGLLRSQETQLGKHAWEMGNKLSLSGKKEEERTGTLKKIQK